jgi:hypothetical protein
MNAHKSLRFPTQLSWLVLIIFLSGAGVFAQQRDPKPQDATKAILAAFDKYEVVGMGAAHGFKELDDYILSLIRNPAFPDKVNTIVVECGNCLYQDTLDRYIAGEDVPLAKMELVWRNTTQIMCSLSGFYEQLFPLVRQINQKLPLQKRLRVVAANLPIDWSKVQSQDDYVAIRNNLGSTITTVIMTEVLAKKRKALLLFGEGHLAHKGLNVNVAEYEQTYPGVTFTIWTHHGFGPDNALDVHNDRLEARMKSWPIPSLVPIKGTWLADLDLAYFAEFVTRSMAGIEIADAFDAYLYLGPRDTLSREHIPDDILNDKSYIEELNKRAWPFRPVDVASVRRRDLNPRLYAPTPESRTPDARMPFAKFVGVYTSESDAIEIAIDIHHDKLFARMPKSTKAIALTPVTDNRFRLEELSDGTFLDFEVVNLKVNGATLDQGEGKPKVKLRWNP